MQKASIFTEVLCGSGVLSVKVTIRALYEEV